jgi:hypothetical protein
MRTGSCEVLLTILGVIIAAAAPGQEVQLVLDREVQLLSGSGTWDVASLANGETAIAIATGTTLNFKMRLDDNWRGFAMSQGFGGLCMYSDSVLKACVFGNNLMRLFQLPSGIISDTLVFCPNYHYEVNETYPHRVFIVIDRQFTLERVLFFPPLPEISTLIVANGSAVCLDVCEMEGCNHHCFGVSDFVTTTSWDLSGAYALLSNICAPPYGDRLTFELSSALRSGDSLLVGHVNWWSGGNFAVGFQRIRGWFVSNPFTFITALSDQNPNWPSSNRRLHCAIRWLRSGASSQPTLVALPRYVTSARADSIFAAVPGQAGLRWVRPGPYSEVFGTDLSSSVQGEEVLALRAEENRFDILNTETGELLGSTSLFEGSHSDIKLISPQNYHYRRLAVRDSNLIRLYWIGEPVSVDPQTPSPTRTQEIEIASHPEPANEFVRFALSTPIVREGEIVVFNLLGREATRVKLVANSSNVTLDITGLPAGIYFARLNANERAKVHKFVIVRQVLMTHTENSRLSRLQKKWGSTLANGCFYFSMRLSLCLLTQLPE